jgi:ribosome-associated toxin RatA of RatAB toxin-antitoxin module
MTSVEKSVLVPYSATQMFELVERFEDYPQFLPWCGDAAIIERASDAVVARIEIQYRGVRAQFTTMNRSHPPDVIVMTLRDGPFRRLDGTWRFMPLAESACKVQLELHYEFATPVLEQLIGPVFNHIADTFVDAFVRRAEAVYGMRSAFR